MLITDDEGLSTPEVYRAYDVVRAEDGAAFYAGREEIDPFEVPPSFFQALLTGEPTSSPACLRNQLEAGSFRLRPELEETIDREVGGAVLAGIVSGFGPTIALLCEDAATADRRPNGCARGVAQPCVRTVRCAGRTYLRRGAALKPAGRLSAPG